MNENNYNKRQCIKKLKQKNLKHTITINIGEYVNVEEIKNDD